MPDEEPLDMEPEIPLPMQDSVKQPTAARQTSEVQDRSIESISRLFYLKFLPTELACPCISACLSACKEKAQFFCSWEGA